MPVIILPPQPTTDFSGFSGTALLDTGATVSAVTPRVSKAIGLSRHGKRLLGSAQGLGHAERLIFRLGFQLVGDAPSFPFVFEEVIGFELTDSFQLDALIGMDILRQCDFSMSRKGRCRLTFG